MPKRDWITNDFGWKLFSLILAAAVWIAIRRNIGETLPTAALPTAVMPFSSMDTVIFTNLPVHAISSSGDVHNVQISPNAVAVQLSGPPAIMAVLEKDKIHAVVNLSDVAVANGLRLPVEVSAPSGVGVTVDKIDPSQISVTISPPTE